MKNIKKLNFKIITCLIILAGISIYTLGNINSLLAENVQGIDYAKKQFIGITLAVIGMSIVFMVNLSLSKRIINIFYYILVGMLLILATDPPIIGNFFVNNANGANGWFMLFSPRFSIQPVEFFKILLVLKLAAISKEHLEGNAPDKYLMKKYVVYGLIPIGLVLIEPDLGGAVLLLFTWFVMCIFSLKDKKIQKKIVLGVLSGLILFIFLLIFDQGQNFLIKFTPLEAYQLDRIDSWLKPFTTDKGYQLQQALIFMGSAGPWGHGAGYDMIALSEPQTDLIFAAVVGFFGWGTGLIVIFSYGVLMWEILSIGQKQTNIEYQFICIGFAALFFIQIFENVGMIIGLLPITGIVLPYMSYGISALLTFFAIAGIILNINKNEL